MSFKWNSQMIPTAVIPILLPLNYTIRLLLFETPHRQPRKPMTIWLSPHRVSRIPTSNNTKKTVKWIVLCFSSLELKCKPYFPQWLAMVSLLVEGALTSRGGVGMQESLKYHSRLKDSVWMSLENERNGKVFRNITGHEKNATLCPEKGQEE